MTIPATPDNAAHLLRRAAFGGRPEDITRTRADGIEETVERLLSFVPEPDPAPASLGDPNASDYQQMIALQAWWMDRMAFGPNPLREKLTLFWHNHFATSNDKVDNPLYMYAQNSLFRRIGAGRFDDLVLAVAKDPAMLVWLDSNQNKKSSPNENWARELMELFTMGVNNYTQDDVVAGARAFTGWFLNTTTGQFQFNAAQHDTGSKTFLGQTGAWDGADIINMVVNSPVSPDFLSRKLWTWFAGGADEGAIADLRATWVASGHDLTATLRRMFTHPSFYTETTKTSLIRQPAEFAAGAMKGLNVRAAQAPLWRMVDLGQWLFFPPNVGGWGYNAYWINTSTSSSQAGFAGDIVYAAIKNGGSPFLQEVQEMPPRDAVRRIFGRLGVVTVSAQTQGALEYYLRADRETNGYRPVQLYDIFQLALLSPEYLMN